MANVIIDENYLINIANNIRNKTGYNNTYNIYEMGPAINNISVSIKTSDASYLFDNNERFNEASGILNILDNVTNMYYTFNNSIISSFSESNYFNTNKVTNMHYAFNNCRSLVTVESLNTSNVTEMFRMFENCTNLRDIPFLDTSNVFDMTLTFNNCTNLSENSYATITNMLPNANQLTNQSSQLATIGLNVYKFNPIQISILNNKGYTDANFSNLYSNIYEIEYTEG